MGITFTEDQLQKLGFYNKLASIEFDEDTIRAIFGHEAAEDETIDRLKTYYAAVYFVGLEDSAFWSFRNQPDEDRCTFFVALSRAKESVAFTFCKRRTAIRNPMQQHKEINEFFDLLQRPGVAEVKTISRNPNPLV